MSQWWRSTKRRLGQILQVILLFAIVRTLFGVGMIAFFDRDAVAWSAEMTLVTLAAVAVCVAAALAVRRWSPPRRGAPRAR